MYLAAQLSLPVCSLRDRRRRSVFKLLVVWMAYHAGQFGDRARGIDGGVFVWGAAGWGQTALGMDEVFVRRAGG